ncbi:heme ABC transporter ATP-binding protein [uncultured Pseudoteredinibacter sp.]|uniref:heme ABC transporter ATP-binding protein n=1 Tax=uncultured Pseudoteredinibacter sp. TaxID=1641701 RepID=UPI00262E71CF|nr:heme ABC transporter ATP-binding protein [uncultured Pseudoteredinibacter sp.]
MNKASQESSKPPIKQFACLEAQNLSVLRSGIEVLKNISFSACAGELVVIIGPNGAGKSSLLKAMSGELPAASGAIHIHELEIAKLDASQRAQSLAVLSQHTNLNFPFSVSEVVEMGRMPFATGRAYDQEVCAKAMQTFDCYDYHGRTYTQLSGGEQQRAQLARVFAQAWPKLAYSPQYIFLDEPNSSLDLSHQKMLLEACRQRAKDNAVLILVLHDLNLACQYADRILLLDKGQLKASGKPWEVCTETLLSEVYQVDVKVVQHPSKDCPVVYI